jgi:hypothetical protein
MNPTPQHPVLTRRSLLQAGALGLLRLGMSDVAALRAAAAPPGEMSPLRYPKARSVIFVFLHGGLSQHDSFDLKPAAPAEIRGEFRPTATRTPGVQVCEHLPLLARVSPLWSLCRSLTHKENSHGPACHSVLSGRTQLPPGSPGGCGAPPTPGDWPSMASLVTYGMKARNNLPPAIVFPATHPSLGLRPGQSAGRLGAKWDPWFIQPCTSTTYGCLPDAFAWASSPEKGEYVVPARCPDPDFFRAPNLTLPEAVGPGRFATRLELLQEVERQRRQLDRLAAAGKFDQYRERAVALLTGDPTRRALFDVTHAPAREQDRYGRTEWGWLLLLARRLVEAGVPLVQVTLDRNAGWDTHRDNFGLLKNYLLPPFDRALSALLEDLHERGLLAETLVVVASEFGRSPKLIRHEQGKSQPGRDHWAKVQTILLAGGGVQGGRVIGSSDATGGAPASDPQTPENLGSTIYHALGIPRRTVWHAKDEAERNPQPLYQGEPIPGLV